MGVSIYKYIIFAIDILLIFIGVMIFFNMKKYLDIHKNETVKENEEKLNSYLKKLKLISIICVVLGIAALLIGIFGNRDLNI